MSQYLKPQAPLYNEGHDEYIYPLTTTSQVIDEETGHRLDVEGVFKRDILTLEEMQAVTGNLDDYVVSASCFKDALKWKYLGQAILNTEIGLPSNFNELSIDISLPTNSVGTTIHVLKEEIYTRTLNEGYGWGNGYYLYRVQVSPTTLRLSVATEVIQDAQTDAVIKVYYR